MAKEKTPSKGSEKERRKKKGKQPTQHNPKGTRVKILGANGKFRWDWQ